ncbi:MULTISPECIES: hypothetical protein [Cyanophyceae]|uniref:Uncharacterized protein n=1 Tax=Nodularia spumigena CENA596 TaxID=1819295 RepID=A0A166J4A9_NODSP|nr:MULTISPECIES: hypothetical protein [Cyanophyceae]MDB9327020.1 hypothetical protein [Nodularia spumigena CS-590/02]MDB9355412.1 hypothetical protein [Nodularia spumigena CS-587/03]MDB9370522.1 hypothetical protein [Nodularia spumigena CS-586/05]KZL49207.1 hypothetical protein A2T98_14025 [Nodularia spumigena CENA596]MDB9318925.1 hypothetical protein [Nodularia spumigena CS-590/01A]
MVSTLADSEFVESELSGYSFKENQITYGEIEQRWLVVQSQVRKESDLRKLSQKIIKAEEKAVRELKKLSQDKFACDYGFMLAGIYPGTKTNTSRFTRK